jgi:glycosyltransferase involved in cell wall biosynthesis
MSAQKIYFYPHGYFRDRQLDTIRNWPRSGVLNPSLAESRLGEQVGKEKSFGKGIPLSWKQRLPFINVKLRPSGLPKEAIVYVWGAVIASGPFILDLDSPYALTGYNLKSMRFYRSFLRRYLNHPRCIAIRCMSEACRETLRLLFGEEVYARSTVHYPYIRAMIEGLPEHPGEKGCRLLFIGTQFEIKGGGALLRAFRRVYEAEPTARLDLITHLPPAYAALAASCPGIAVHEAYFTREEVSRRFMRGADVLVHPTYVDSFGMAALEGLAHGLAVIATDVYALKEMVRDKINGSLLTPPISIWDGYLPSRYYYDLPRFKEHLEKLDTRFFEDSLADAMLRLARNPADLLASRRASLDLLKARFLREDCGDA